jgi:hypothetical protein
MGLAIGCSPVKFAQTTSACTVNNPCVTSTGTSHVGQDQLFTKTNRVDIIVVDDNSGSMHTEQSNMAAAFNGAIQNLITKGQDFQIGITTTDVCPQGDAPAGFCPAGDNAANGQFIGPSTAAFGMQNVISWSPSNPNSNAATQFANTIYRPEQGSGDERGIFALNKALDQKDSANAGFFRSNSNLAVIILSDEDERSVGGLNTNDPAYAPLADYDQPQTFLNKATALFGSSKTVLVNSIVIKPGDTACLNQQAAQPPVYTAHYGNTYKTLANLTGGQTGSICDNGAGSFAAMLNNITAQIANIPSSNIMTLNYIPNAQPTLTFTPAANAVSWTWTPGTNQITFAVRPADGTTVHAEYDFDSSQLKTQMSQSNPFDIGFTH